MSPQINIEPFTSNKKGLDFVKDNKVKKRAFRFNCILRRDLHHNHQYGTHESMEFETRRSLWLYTVSKPAMSRSESESAATLILIVRIPSFEIDKNA